MLKSAEAAPALGRFSGGTGKRQAPPRKHRQLSEARYGALLVAPGAAIIALVLAYPVLHSLWMSLHDINLFQQQSRFVGLGNYAELFSDPVFWRALFNTVYFAVMVIAGTLLLGLTVALVLNMEFFGRPLLRSIVIVPWALSQVTVGLLWGWIFNSSFGALNGAFFQLGLIDEYIGWLANPNLVMALLAGIFVWSAMPFSALLLLAALQTVPGDILKAAMVDGARPFQRFRLIVLPWIRPTLLVVVVLATLNGFLAFALIFLMTGGGPGTSTTVLSWMGFQTSFAYADVGKGAAIFWILTLINFALVAVYLKFMPLEAGGEDSR